MWCECEISFWRIFQLSSAGFFLLTMQFVSFPSIFKLMLNSTRIVWIFQFISFRKMVKVWIKTDRCLVLQNEQSEAGQFSPGNFQCKLESMNPISSSSSVNLKATHLTGVQPWWVLLTSRSRSIWSSTVFCFHYCFQCENHFGYCYSDEFAGVFGWRSISVEFISDYRPRLNGNAVRMRCGFERFSWASKIAEKKKKKILALKKQTQKKTKTGKIIYKVISELRLF